MLTNAGKTQIGRFLAKQTGSIAESMAFGVSSTAATVADTSLGFEVERSDVELTSYDPVTGRLTFKAAMPATMAGTVYEIGLWSQAETALAGEYGSGLLVAFDSGEEVWSVGNYSSDTYRVGVEGLRLTPAANTSAVTENNDVHVDLSAYSGTDKFMLACNVGTTNTQSIVLSLMTDSSNYYQMTFSNPAVGYRVLSVNKGLMGVTGTPDWADINTIRITVLSKIGGPSQVDLDAIRIEDMDNTNVDYELVARKVLDTPYVKDAGKEDDIEYAIQVNFA